MTPFNIICSNKRCAKANKHLKGCMWEGWGYSKSNKCELCGKPVFKKRPWFSFMSNICEDHIGIESNL